MAEVIEKIEPEMPAGYDKLSGIEITKQKDGQVRYSGLLELGEGEDMIVRKVLIPEPDMLWGYDPEDYQGYKGDPEKWEMKQNIKRLEGALTELQNDHASLRADYESLKAKIGGDAASPAQETPAAAEADDTAVEPSSPDAADSPAETPETTTVETAEVETPDQKSWWQRTRDRVMGPVYGSHAATITRRKKYEYDDEGRVIVEVEESDERQRRTGLIAGATALVGAGAGLGLGYLIWHKTGYDVNHYYYNGAEVAGPPVMPGSGAGNPMNTISGSHVDFFSGADGSSGMRRTGVMLPQELHLQNVSGHQEIVDSHNNVVVGQKDVPSGMTDRQGNLSAAARNKLRSMGYVLSQTKLGGRFMTFVQGG
jgi:hypothetical protein